MEITHPSCRQWLREFAFSVALVGLGGEEDAGGREDVHVAYGDEEELESERDGVVAAEVGDDGREMAAC